MNIQETSNKNIGNNIALVRKIKGLTQKELAQKLKISQPAMGNYERGVRAIPATTLNELSIKLNVPIEFITRGIPHNILPKDIHDMDMKSLMLKAAHADNKEEILTRAMGRDDVKRHMLATVLSDNYDVLTSNDPNDDNFKKQLRNLAKNCLNAEQNREVTTTENDFLQVEKNIDLIADVFLSLIVDDYVSNFPAERRELSLPLFKKKLTEFLDEYGYMHLLN